MQNDPPILDYEAPRRPNRWAVVSLVAGFVLLFGSFVPICGLAVIPLAWVGVIVGLAGVGLAIRGRRGLKAAICGSVLCLAAALIPLAMLGTVPFLAELGLKIWSSNNRRAAPAAVSPATSATTQATTYIGEP